MTDPSNVTHIFISHSSEDSEFVDRFAEDLKKVGIPIWVDHKNLARAIGKKQFVKRSKNHGLWYMSHR